MPLFDLPGDRLADYRGSTRPPADLADFWQRTLTESRALASPPTAVRVETGLRLVETYDVTFSGFGGHPVRAWFHRPAGGPETTPPTELPVVVRFQGYGAGRALAHQVPLWTLAGYACLHVDTRGQGAWSSGDTPDPIGSAPAVPGFMTKGIEHPETYYYRRVFTDAVLAVDAAGQLAHADPGRVVVTGISQGGGITLAVAGLHDGVAAVMADVPFLSDFPRAVEIATKGPYGELLSYLSIHRRRTAQVFETLAYFDASVLARSASAPALLSVALMDQTCPPSTVYAAYNAYGGPKDITVYPYNDHEGGQQDHEVAQLAWLARTIPLR